MPIASSPASLKLVSVTEPREPTNARVPLVIRIGGTADSTKAYVTSFVPGSRKVLTYFSRRQGCVTCCC